MELADGLEKFLRRTEIIRRYKERIIEFGCFPHNRSYPNGTAQFCHEVKVELYFDPLLTDEEKQEFWDAGFFGGGLSETVADATFMWCVLDT